MRDRFNVRKFDYVVDYDAADSILTNTDESECDLSEAIDVLRSDCWDNIDVSPDSMGGSTIMCYPADWHKDYRTGEVTHTDVAISGPTRWIDRLYTYYTSKYDTCGRKKVTA